MRDELRTAIWFILAGFLFISGVKVDVVYAQSSDSVISPKIERLLLKGLAAAEQQSWGLAIENFSKVQKAAPEYPPALLNLGLAHARVGHEIPAIVWLRAYAVLSPGALNLPDVEKEIIRLEVAAETKIGKLFDQAVKTAETLSEENYVSKNALTSVYLDQAASGDIDGAITTYRKVYPDYDHRNSALSLWAGQKVEEGDIEGAFTILQEMSSQSSRASALAGIADHYRKAEDLDEAIKVMSKVPDGTEVLTRQYLIEALAKAGRYADAVAMIEKLNPGKYRFEAWLKISHAQAEAKNLEAAGNSIDKALTSYAEPDKYDLDEYLYNLVLAQTAAGDIRGAEKTITRMQSGWRNDRAAESLAVALMDAGRSADSRRQFSHVSGHQGKFVNYYIKTGDLKTAMEMALTMKGYAFSPHIKIMAIGRVAYETIKGEETPSADMILSRWDLEYFGENRVLKWVAIYFAEAGKAKQALMILNGINKYEPFMFRLPLVKIVDAQIKAGELEEARMLFEKHGILFDIIDRTDQASTNRFAAQKSRLRLVDAYLDAQKPQPAAEVLRMAYKTALIMGPSSHLMNKIKERSNRLGIVIPGSDDVSAIRAEAWTILARKLSEDESTGSPERYLTKIKTGKPSDAPKEISRLAADLTKGLRQIRRLEKRLEDM